MQLQHRRYISVAGFILGVALAAQSVKAQEIETLEVFGGRSVDHTALNNRSALKLELPLLEVPQSISIVGKQEIQDKGALILRDALKGVPGIASPSGEGARDQFTIRGFDALNDIYRNGLRDGTSNQVFRSLANIERVEVIKGASGALYGRGSAGGLINLVTKKADGENIFDVQFDGGSFKRRAIRTDIGGVISEGVNARVNLEYKTSDSFVDRADSETLFIAPTMRFDLGEDTRLDFDIEYLEQDITPVRGVPSLNGRPINVDESTSFASSSDYQEARSILGSLNLVHNFNKNTQWTNRIYYGNVDLEQSGTRNTTVTAGQLGRRIVSFAFDPQEETGVQSELNFDWGINKFLVGLDFNRLERVSTSVVTAAPSTPIFQPANFTYQRPNLNPNRTNEVDSTAVYLQDVIEFNDQWKLLLTGRYDTIKVDQVRANGSKFDTNDSKLSPRAGLVFLPGENTSVYATVGRAYQLPFGGIFATSTRSALLKTDLVELGFKWNLLGDRLTFTSSVFSIERESPETNVFGEIIKVNNDKHEGIELELKGEVAENWLLSLGYTHLDAENTDSSFKPNDVPADTASLWATYELMNGFKIGGGVNYVGKRYVGNNEAETLDSYSTVDLMASYEWQQHAIQVNANNVFDKKYFQGATDGGSGLNQINHGAPININLSYRYSFF